MAYPTGWNRTCPINISNTYVIGSANHTSYLMLVTLNHIPTEMVDAGSNSALNGGGDIRFDTAADGTGVRLPCHIQHFVTNATAGSRRCTIWVEIPTLLYNSTTTIHALYNKAGETQPAAGAAYGRDAAWNTRDFATSDMATDYTGNQTITVGNAPTAESNAPWGGDSVAFNGTNDYVTFPIDGTPSINITGNICIQAMLRADGTAPSSYGRWFDVRNGSGTIQGAVDTDWNDSDFCFGTTTSTDVTQHERDANGPIDTWELHTGRSTSLGTANDTLRINQADQTVSYSGWGVGTNNSDFNIGRRSDATNYGEFDCALFTVRVASVSNDLVDTEYNNLLNDANFASAGTPAALGGATYTLTAATGSYTHTGQAAGLKVSRKLAAANGSYSLTGQSTGLAVARKLISATASYTLTGNTATLKVGRKIAASGGSFVLTGIAAGLNVSRKLAAENGSYTLTGYATALKASRTLVAGNGSYSLTGQNTALKVSRRMAAASGGYTLTGISTGLIAGRKITAASGSYTLTGYSATLTYNSDAATYSLSAASGSYALSGQAVVFRASRKLIAATSAYVVTGYNTGLIKSSVLSAAASSYSLTGQDAGLAAGRKIAASNGDYTLTGIDAAFKASRKLTLDSGSFILTGIDTGFTYGTTISPSAQRTATIGSNNRTSAAQGNRTHTAVSGSRALTTSPRNRTSTAQSNDRTRTL